MADYSKSKAILETARGLGTRSNSLQTTAMRGPFAKQPSPCAWRRRYVNNLSTRRLLTFAGEDHIRTDAATSGVNRGGGGFKLAGGSIEGIFAEPEGELDTASIVVLEQGHL